MKKKVELKIAFFGTPDFAVHVLEELEKGGVHPILIITAPDRPQGRKLEIKPPPVKEWAKEQKTVIAQPEFLNEVFVEDLANNEWDLFIVASYGQIFPKRLLGLPKHGTLNIHPSLLPRWRGASPIQSAILNDNGTGVTIMLMDEEMDHGPIVAQASVEVEGWPPKASLLSELLAVEGGRLLAEVIPAWLEGNIEPEKQKHEEATYTKKITKEDGRIDLSRDAEKNYRKIQAYDLWPGTYFFAKRSGREIRIKVVEATLEGGELVLRRVIPEGKKEMNYEDFLRSS